MREGSKALQEGTNERRSLVMGDEAVTPVSVSRKIEAPAGEIFDVLTHPGNHPTIDGSGMLRQGASNDVISGLGDVFVMKMNNPQMGDYEMDNHIVEFETNRRIGWEPAMHGTSREEESPLRNGSRWLFTLDADGPDATVVTETYDCSGSPEMVRTAVDNGKSWIEAMTQTLAQLEEACASRKGGGK
jgi:hypothetical protein